MRKRILFRAWLLTILPIQLMLVSCSQEPLGTVDDEPPPDAASPPDVVQLEVPDRVVDLYRSMDVRSMEPGLRVGLRIDGHTRAYADILAALQSRTALLELGADSASVVPVEIRNANGYEVHPVDASDATHDVLGTPRLYDGYSLVPSEPLADGWYAIVVDVEHARALGLNDEDGSLRLFSNVELDSVLVSRFYLGELNVLAEVAVACGPIESFGLAAPPTWEAGCQFVVHVAGTDSAVEVLPDVQYDDVAADCVLAEAPEGSRPLRGRVCRQPTEGSLVSVSVAGEGEVDESAQFAFELNDLGLLEGAPPGTRGFVLEVGPNVGLETVETWVADVGW